MQELIDQMNQDIAEVKKQIEALRNELTAIDKVATIQYHY